MRIAAVVLIGLGTTTAGYATTGVGSVAAPRLRVVRWPRQAGASTESLHRAARRRSRPGRELPSRQVAGATASPWYSAAKRAPT